MIVLWVFLAAKVIVLAVTGTILYKVFAPDLKRRKPLAEMAGVKCVYCHFSPALYHSEETRWEADELVLVKTYECRRCHMPFWRIERLTAVEHHPT
ncbi:MAG TPA: hypothetical protein VFB34_14170 [Chloroflexota bacterium]|nr:hypothetical protein [Chloroflexota bacterium]